MHYIMELYVNIILLMPITLQVRRERGSETSIRRFDWAICEIALKQRMTYVLHYTVQVSKLYIRMLTNGIAFYLCL